MFLSTESAPKERILLLQPHQESNLDLKFRKLLFYPLNYEADCSRSR